MKRNKQICEQCQYFKTIEGNVGDVCHMRTITETKDTTLHSFYDLSYIFDNMIYEKTKFEERSISEDCPYKMEQMIMNEEK